MAGTLLDPGARFHLVDSGWEARATSAQTSLGSDGMVSPSTTSATSSRPWHPDSGLFAFAALAAVAVGAMAFSTTFRVGPRKATIVVGETK